MLVHGTKYVVELENGIEDSLFILQSSVYRIDLRCEIK